jgi:hypothetical protein
MNKKLFVLLFVAAMGTQGAYGMEQKQPTIFIHNPIQITKAQASSLRKFMIECKNKKEEKNKRKRYDKLNNNFHIQHIKEYCRLLKKLSNGERELTCDEKLLLATMDNIIPRKKSETNNYNKPR